MTPEAQRIASTQELHPDPQQCARNERLVSCRLNGDKERLGSVRFNVRRRLTSLTTAGEDPVPTSER